MLRIGICINTFRRPEGVLTLVGAVSRQKFSRIEKPSILLSVVSNEDDPVLQKLVEDNDVFFSVELERSIPKTRNRASRKALDAGVDFLVYIDDDEEPAIDWLENLIVCQSEFNADVVYGAVDPRIVEKSYVGIADASYFCYPRYPRGEGLSHAYTHNVLLRAQVFEEVGAFDERWGLNGGDDTAFFSNAVALGFKIVACPEAVVVERIESERTTLSYLCRRSFRHGNSEALLEVYGPSKRGGRFRCGMFGVAMLLKRLFVFIVAALTFCNSRWVNGLLRICFALGLVLGSLGFRYEIYRR